MEMLKRCSGHLGKKEEKCIMEDFMRSEYSEEFDQKRKALMEQSFYKYGSARANYVNGNIDAIASLELCLEKFKETKNTEYLLDVANYAMLRYMYPQAGEYFRYTSSVESAGIVGISVKEMEALKEK